MRLIGKLFIGFVILTVVVFIMVVVFANKSQQPESRPVAQATPKADATDSSATDQQPHSPPTEATQEKTAQAASSNAQPAASQESDQVLEAYMLSRNPYRWKGQWGILDNQMPAIAANGAVVGMLPYPAIKFERMINEHVATYAVLESGEDSGDELAVVLPDSNPPDSRRPWRVLVDGPLDATTGTGEGLTLTALEFKGYYVPPKQAATSQPEQPAGVIPTEAASPSAGQPTQAQQPSPPQQQQ